MYLQLSEFHVYEGKGRESIDPFAGIIQIKFDRIISASAHANALTPLKQGETTSHGNIGTGSLRQIFT